MALAAEEKSEKEAPFLAILEHALRCRKQNDQAGYQAACREWLLAKHDVRIGDKVVLVGSYLAKPRTVLLEDFRIDLNEHDLLHSFAFFIGPCLSHMVRSSNPRSHSQFLHDNLLKTTT
jgi:hypothetical protein